MAAARFVAFRWKKSGLDANGPGRALTQRARKQIVYAGAHSRLPEFGTTARILPTDTHRIAARRSNKRPTDHAASGKVHAFEDTWHVDSEHCSQAAGGRLQWSRESINCLRSGRGARLVP
jgi:hypothetical protein